METTFNKKEKSPVHATAPIVPINTNNNNIKVKIKKLHPDAKIPTYATNGSLGMDLYSVDCKYDAEIDAFIYYTGLAVELPEGYGMFPIPQSRNRNTECYIPNTPGLVDGDYRGEVQVTYKTRDRFSRVQPFKVGEKCGQIVILPCPKIEFEEVEELSKTERGNGGHGSTGN